MEVNIHRQSTKAEATWNPRFINNNAVSIYIHNPVNNHCNRKCDIHFTTHHFITLTSFTQSNWSWPYTIESNGVAMTCCIFKQVTKITQSLPRHSCFSLQLESLIKITSHFSIKNRPEGKQNLNTKTQRGGVTNRPLSWYR